MYFFFNDTATTEIYTLSLHDALPISCGRHLGSCCEGEPNNCRLGGHVAADANLSLRLVACAPAQANLREAQSYAGGSGSERKELKGRKQRLEGRLGKGDSSAPTDVLSGCGRGAHLTSRRRCPGAGDCERRCSVLNGFFAGGCRAVQSLQFRQPLSYLTRVFGMRS